LRSLFDPSSPILKPTDIVRTFTGKSLEELRLPRRAIITFSMGDVKALLKNTHQKPIKTWSGFRSIFRIDNTETVITRCLFGGPNVAALVEELSAFGVREFVLWGYCGGISDDLSIGDVLIAEGALRQDGVSYHYLDSADDFVYTGWLHKWQSGCYIGHSSRIDLELRCFIQGDKRQNQQIQEDGHPGCGNGDSFLLCGMPFEKTKGDCFSCRL